MGGGVPQSLSLMFVNFTSINYRSGGWGNSYKTQFNLRKLIAGRKSWGRHPPTVFFFVELLDTNVNTTGVNVAQLINILFNSSIKYLFPKNEFLNKGPT